MSNNTSIKNKFSGKKFRFVHFIILTKVFLEVFKNNRNNRQSMDGNSRPLKMYILKYTQSSVVAKLLD